MDVFRPISARGAPRGQSILIEAEEILMHDHHEHSHAIQSKQETIACISYALHHNEHHEEELAALEHSLEHLHFDREAAEVRLCIDDFRRGSERLRKVLSALEAE
jgi:hypothetical protein